MAGLRPQLLDEVRDLRRPAGRRGAGLSPACGQSLGAGVQDRGGRGGLLRTVDRFNPEARRARDPQFGRGDTLFDRYFGAFYPRLGRFSPDARFPAATAKARTTIAAAIGPVVSKLAGRVAKKNDPERMRSIVVGPLAKIIRPVLKSPKSSVLGPIDTPPYYALEVRASALGTVGGPKTDAVGRALTTEGNVIPGLFAAGNAGGAPLKGFYGGAGGTISLGLVFGYLAGREASQRTQET
nr:FAD-binding protein [Actinomadura sp. 6K520]